MPTTIKTYQKTPIFLKPEQWTVILDLLEEKQAHLEMYIKNKPKAATTVSRNKCSDIEEILMDIADQHLLSDEDEES